MSLIGYIVFLADGFRTQCGITILCSPSAGRAWEYPKPGARSFSASQKESNADINGIIEVTAEVIAYISTLVLSDLFRDRENFLTQHL